jgi:DNA repair exonuclease SbcCD ATPase subunit
MTRIAELEREIAERPRHDPDLAVLWQAKDNAILRLRGQIDRLTQEGGRLRSESEQLRTECAVAQHQSAEVPRLRSEVEQLRDALTKTEGREAELKQEIEKLSKAVSGWAWQASEVGPLREREAALRKEVATLHSQLVAAKAAGAGAPQTAGPTPSQSVRVVLVSAAAAESVDPRPPRDLEQEWRQRIRDAERQGWRPEYDSLVSLKRQEVELENRVARLRSIRGYTGARWFPLGADRAYLAMRAALEARAAYVESPPKERRTQAYWEIEFYQLDAESEAALRQQTAATLEELERERRGR